MKIICAVKFVPDVDSVVNIVGTATGDPETIRTGRHPRMILNPDDACSLAFALQVKAGNPGCSVEVVSAGPLSVRPHMEDLLRLPVDRATLISGRFFDEGNSSGRHNSSVTGDLLAGYIADRPYDCLLTGTQTLDGGSASVPVQLAEALGLDQMLGIIRVDPHRFDTRRAVFEVADDTRITTYEMVMPCVLSLTRESGYKLPYVKLTDMRRDVSDDLTVITAEELGFSEGEEGRTGSFTRVMNIYPKTYDEKDRHIVQNDEAGITEVFDFLKAEGFL
ncbi:MAG: electron transfer flavoprotein subunit beta/FixA family protein [Desulfobacteraceae bacterium]|nr:MAG: electron transfer flavoprotein subunit beta/FixA family protein [Desulfobacteraceae bacterium]